MSKRTTTDSSFSVNISATFTAETLTPILEYWFERLRLETTISHAPYNQVFQSLLDSGSLFQRNETGLNIILLRPEDWQRFRNLGSNEWKDGLLKNTREFLEALDKKAAPHASRYLVILTEPSEAITSDAKMLSLIQKLENEITQACQNLTIPLVSREAIQKSYPVQAPLDSIADQEGHLPYRDSYTYALGTLIARLVHATLVPTPKVIVVDADNTVWQGVVAEVGAEHLNITPPFVALQRFLKARQQE